MARQTKFTPIETAEGWRLNVPQKYTQSGRRERHFYRTQREAQAAAKSLKQSAAEFGHQSQAIRPSLAEDATAAEALLKPYEVTLLDAARFYLEAKKTESASQPVDAAIMHWISDIESRLRGKSVTNCKQTMKRFAELGGKMLSSVTREDLQNIVAPAGMAPTSAAGHFRCGMAFWNWSARRGWCDAALYSKLDRPAKSQRKRIAFLTPEAADALLRSAAQYFPAVVGHFAIGLFAGVRPAELEILDPETVGVDGIEVGADESKGLSRRHIHPCETLAQWLTKYPYQTARNWDRVWDAVRRLAGWEVKSEFAEKMVAKGVLSKLPPATRGAWPQDVMRHTCGTYHVAFGEDLGGMAFWFGHTGGETTLRRYYVGKAKRKQALEFFAIVPEGAEAPQQIKPVQSVA
jgi:integrase